MSLIKKNNIISDETRLKIATTLSKGEYVMVKKNETPGGEIISFISILFFFLGYSPSKKKETEKLQNLLSCIQVI